jgi:hypothetical protein
MLKNTHKDRTVKPGCTYLQLGTWEEFKLHTKRLMARIRLNLVAAPNGKDHCRQLLYELTRYPTCKRWTPSNKHPRVVITYFSLQTHLLSVISQNVVCLIQLNISNTMRSNKKFTAAQFDLLFIELCFIYYGTDWLGAGFIVLQSTVVRLLYVGSTTALREKQIFSLSTKYLGVRYVYYSKYQLFLYTGLTYLSL